MEKIWEFLSKVAHGLRAISEVTSILAALIEALVGRFGPGFGFAAA